MDFLIQFSEFFHRNSKPDLVFKFLAVFSISCVSLFTAADSFAALPQNDTLELSKGVFVSPEYLLEGAVSGLKVTSTDGNIAGAVTTSVRGHNASYITSNPVWIVDGVVLSDCSLQFLDAFDSKTYGKFNYTPKLSQLDFLNLYDIEQIQVLKNISETAQYGTRGANGVVIITTKQGKSEKPSVVWHTHLGFPWKNGLTHNHDLSVGFNKNRLAFRLSAFYRDFQGSYSGSGFDRNGGLRLNFDMKTNKIIWFGFNASAAMGRQSMQSAAASYGVPTMGLALQGIQIPAQLNSVEGWATDHDDYADYFRSNGNIYLQLNFLKFFQWKTDVNFDINNAKRYNWYGLGTEFGKQFSRAAAIDANALFSYQINTAFRFERHINVYHKVSARLSGSFYVDINRYNKMSGDHFMTDALREKGFSLRESAATPHQISKDYCTWALGGEVSYAYKTFVGVIASCTADKQPRYDSSFFVYPAANAWVNIHDIAFPKSQAVSALELTGGWGKAGYRAYLPYQLSGRAMGQNLIDAALLQEGIVIDNADAKTTLGNFFDGYDYGLSSEWNVGLKAGFLSDRIKLDLAYWSKQTTETFTVFGFGRQRFDDSFVWKTCPKWTLVSNARSFFTRGLEGTIAALIISIPDFQWNASLNLATSHSNLHYMLNDTISTFKPFPSLYGGLDTDFHFFGVSVEMQFSGASGFDLYNMNKMLVDGATAYSADYVEKGDYLRMTRASLGYDIPVRKVKWIKTLRLSVTGTNLFTITPYSGVNPDVSVFGADGNKFAGIDYGALPLVRTILLGIKAEF